MSTELRLKKLRGSGGYVMAQVTDDQQRKGNLGGPDLFLAPIGRLDVEKISKYYCNTCEKDYEGGPKIEFENPNEEVAQNLVLRERGQYLCTTCGSTIAEYREFQKQDQQADVGLAKPIVSNTIQEESIEAPRITPTVESQPIVMTPISPTQSDSFSSITGMSVYDSNAKRVGIAKQVGINSSHQVVLVITKNDGSDQTIEWPKISKIGEIILLGDGTQSQHSSALSCSKCGFENKAGSKFCESCGNKL
ncbi:MAG TPA: zinc-ribbon domain-containing protein [Candidatus Nitrosotenuis sp.]|nr:zinc-ribbon domain-containing protein [Candidatus Nitrosotenuis sp.]